MEKKKITHEQIHTTRDVDGNLIEEETLRESRVPQEPEYVKLYIRDIGRLIGLTKTENSILFALLNSMSYGNVIAAIRPIKRMIAEHTGIAEQTINQTISNFAKRGILIRKERGIYIADPELFGKGRFRDIEKLRLTIEYNENGKRINTERYQKLQSPHDKKDNQFRL